LSERLAHCFQRLLIARETQPILLGDHDSFDPDGKLATVSCDEFCFDIKLFFEQVRHTGGAGFVVSNDAVAYLNRLHCGNLL
jgi:hypothetical protein